jgi:hypothetical protein
MRGRTGSRSPHNDGILRVRAPHFCPEQYLAVNRVFVDQNSPVVPTRRAYTRESHATPSQVLDLSGADYSE